MINRESVGRGFSAISIGVGDGPKALGISIDLDAVGVADIMFSRCDTVSAFLQQHGQRSHRCSADAREMKVGWVQRCELLGFKTLL